MKVRVTHLLFYWWVVVNSVSCSTLNSGLRSLFGGGNEQQTAAGQDGNRVGKIDKKNYRKTTRQSLEEEAELGEESGSLWISRGQGAYLFAQNTNRLIGDLINIEIDGHPKKQVETKVKVIENLLDKIRERNKLRQARGREGEGRGTASQQASAGAAAKGGGKDEFPVKIVPSRIVEILKDGSYRVRGDQPFMIDKREYKLMVTGIIRQADFDDQGISAETLLDPKFDIVTAKGKTNKRNRRRGQRKKA